MPISSFPGLLPRLLSLGILLAALGCTDQEPGAGLYVFNGASHSVLVWENLDKIYDAARGGRELPKPVRTLKSGKFNSLTLAWGGMAMDKTRNKLYLVSEEGKVFVIARPGNQNGDLSKSTDITSFNLGNASSDRLPSGSVFGQASVDTVHDVLFVQENAKDANSARVWHVQGASRIRDGAAVGKDHNTSEVNGDKWGAGVAAGQGHAFYALFGGGDSIGDFTGTGLAGPRLRQGEPRTGGSWFPTHILGHGVNLLVGDKTRLPEAARYGALAYDHQHHELYVLTEPAAGTDPGRILVFGAGQFRGTINQAPRRTLERVPRKVRLIVHPGQSNWLVGLGSDQGGGGRGQASLYIWKEPSGEGRMMETPALAQGAEIRGVAFGD